MDDNIKGFIENSFSLNNTVAINNRNYVGGSLNNDTNIAFMLL